MPLFNHSLLPGFRIVLVAMLAVIMLQGCFQRGAIMVGGCDEPGRGRGAGAPGGCDDVAVPPEGTPAEGWIGVGQGPVVVPSGYTCYNGFKCDPEGDSCNRTGTKHCKTHFYYSTNYCDCLCVAP